MEKGGQRIKCYNQEELFIQRENPVEDKNGVRREILRYPWDEVA